MAPRVTVTDEMAQAEEDGAVAIARLVVGNADSLRPAHVMELLSVAIWKFTEARGKYMTPYTTRAALASNARLRHEHVIPRKQMSLAMLRFPQRVEEIMRLSVACAVTHDEHRLLSGSHVGWHRYKHAGLLVLDRNTREPVDLDAMADALQRAWEQVASPV